MNCGIPTREDDGNTGTHSVLPPRRGIPTREDDGHRRSASTDSASWDPYARGRRTALVLDLVARLVGSLRARTTGRPAGRPSTAFRGIPTREDDGTETGVGPWVQQWGPHARGRRIRHHQTRPYETRPCLSWKQPHPRKGRATLMQHIGERIREYRMLHGLTQEALAEKAGMHPNTIKKLEQGGTARMD